MRIKQLCGHLKQPDTVQEQVYWVVAHVVQEATHLLFNRHLDQIVLASIYGVCKVQLIPTIYTFHGSFLWSGLIP